VIQAWVVTALPVLFLIILFGGGSLFRKRNIDMDGESPINRTVFLASKYLIVVIWTATVLQSWGISFSFFKSPSFIRSISLVLWAIGFSLLFIGRFGMGNSFRIGSPKESTSLRVNGLFRFSRNPMYLGVFTTLLSSVLYTLNPLILLVAIFIVVVHHKIVLAEEEYLQKVFGKEYLTYCGRVGRYI
jgi:protein-S-isoprenylcysteine O-methyltransferase Ste14